MNCKLRRGEVRKIGQSKCLFTVAPKKTLLLLLCPSSVVYRPRSAVLDIKSVWLSIKLCLHHLNLKT